MNMYIVAFVLDVFIHDQMGYAKEQPLWEDELIACDIDM